LTQSGKEGAVAALTSHPDPRRNSSLVKWGDIVEGSVDSFLNPLALKRRIEALVSQVCQGEKFTREDRVRPIMPSTSANYINTRSGQGSLGYLLKNDLLEHLREPGGLLGIIAEENGRMEEDKREDETVTYEILEERFRARYGEAWDELMEKALKEIPLVKAVPLKEALKTRVITKGPPLTGYVLKSLQKKLFKVLRKHSVFRLIGEPDSVENMQENLGSALKAGEIYMSGDYKGATDNILSWISEYVAERFSHELGLTKDEERLFKRALTGHIFDVSEKGKIIKRSERFKVQRRGQLMGSIISFPVLCIVNAVVCQWAIELAEGRRIGLRNLRMAINGDDVVLRSKESVYPYWQKIAAWVGLEESIGKTYVSREFFNINSRTYIRLTAPIKYQTTCGDRTVTRERNFTKVKFINSGLLQGMNRSSVQDVEAHIDDPRLNIGAVAHVLVQETPEKVLPVVYDAFLERHKNALKRLRLPWFIPRWLGGLGLPPLGEKWTNSDLDLRIAARILFNWKKRKPIMLGSEGGPWRIRAEAEKRLPPLKTEDFANKDSIHVQAYERLLGLAGVNLLFDSNVQLSDLYDEKDPTRINLSAIRHNEKLWNPSNGVLPPPIDPVLLETRTRFTGVRLKGAQGDILDNMRPPTSKEVVASHHSLD
jgi:hypothetical protein